MFEERLVVSQHPVSDLGNMDLRTTAPHSNGVMRTTAALEGKERKVLQPGFCLNMEAYL